MTKTRGKAQKKLTSGEWKLISDGVCMLHIGRPETTNLVIVTDQIQPLKDNFASKKAAEKAARSLLPKLRAFAVHTPTTMHLYNAHGQELEWAAVGSQNGSSYVLSVGEPIAA